MKKKKRRRVVVPVIVILIVLALAGFVGYNLFQVKHVLVNGNRQFSTDSIVKLADIPDETQMLKVDEPRIKQNIESNPYLELKSVDYQLPDTVVLTVNEREPIALMSLGVGNSILMDRQLFVLKVNDAEDAGKYPLVAGMAVKSADLGKQVSADAFKISVATSILDELKGQDALGMVTQIDLSDINNIRLKTNGGPDVLFGQSDQASGKIGWVKKMLPTLIDQGKTSGILDVTAGTFATYGQNELPGGTPSAGPDTQNTATQPASPEGTQP